MSDPAITKIDDVPAGAGWCGAADAVSGLGSIETGKDADIAVWDRDPYSVPADDLKDLKCEMTLLHGKVVYEYR